MEERDEAPLVIYSEIRKKTELKHQTGGEKRRVRYLTGDTPGSKQNRKHTKKDVVTERRE